jgi:TolB-like protein
MNELFEEFKHRNVFRVGFAYLTLAWLIIEITGSAVPALNLPETLNSIVFYLSLIGFPFAVLFAWAFELTPDGLKRSSEVADDMSIRSDTGRKLNYVVIGMLVFIAALTFWQGQSTPQKNAGATAAEASRNPLVDSSNEVKVQDTAGRHFSAIKQSAPEPSTDTTDSSSSEISPNTEEALKRSLTTVPAQLDNNSASHLPTSDSSVQIPATESDNLTIEDSITNLEAAVGPIVEDLRSIAILPLANLSADKNNDYFAAGIHEEILNQLAKIKDLKVISRTSVLRYQGTEQTIKNIAKELNVTTVMEGSVRFAGNKVRITCQLIRASDDSHLWSETYDFEMDDIFAIQSDVALRAAEAMQARLLPEEVARIKRVPTTSTEAYTLFLQARYRAEQENFSSSTDENHWLKTGIRDLQRAVKLDPEFADGFAELSYFQFFLEFDNVLVSKNNVLVEAAVASARSALEIDPNSSRALGVLALIASTTGDKSGFESLVQRALELPDVSSDTYTRFALAYSFMGEGYEKANELLSLAIAIDPAKPYPRGLRVGFRIALRQYDLALTEVEHYLAIGGSANTYHLYRAISLFFLKQTNAAKTELQMIDANILQQELVFYPYYGYLHCRLDETTIFNVPSLSVFSRLFLNIGCDLAKNDFDGIFTFMESLRSRSAATLDMGEAMDEFRKDPRYEKYQ